MLRVSHCFWLLGFHCLCEAITVHTSRGSVEGFDQDFGDDKSQRFYGYGQVFLGIPYAKPPVGDRRFALPEDICKYNENGEVHNATYYRPMCYQKKDNVEMSEDCLYLNTTGNYPVMVYIHGGTFTSGSAIKYQWKGAIRNLVSRGVVVVTIQYRLGFFGFFTTYTETFPPNRGMYDQIVVLRWVKEEIANFGGDAERITLFGQSSGAGSVADLSLSPLTRGLFHQLIQTSGNSLMQIETMTDVRGSIHQERAEQICQINATDWGTAAKDQDLLECLKVASPADIVVHDWTGSKLWNVALDGSFMPDYPDKLAESRPKFPALMGEMLEDYAIPGIAKGDLSNINASWCQEFLQLSWPNYDDETAKNISDTMISGFSNGSIPEDDDHLGWFKLNTDMYTGMVYSSLTQRDVQWHQKAGNNEVWLFTFTLRSMLPYGIEYDGWIPITHGSELPYLWFYPDVWETYNATDADLATADVMGELWTDFAKNGNLPYTRSGESMNYIEISDSIVPMTNWRQEADKVFNQQLPSYGIDFPPLPMSEETKTKVKALGEKVSALWNSLKCPTLTTTSAPTERTTSKGSANSFSLAIAFLVIVGIY